VGYVALVACGERPLCWGRTWRHHRGASPSAQPYAPTVYIPPRVSWRSTRAVCAHTVCFVFLGLLHICIRALCT